MKNLGAATALIAGLTLAGAAAAADWRPCDPPRSWWGEASCNDRCCARGCRGFWYRVKNAGRFYNPRGYDFMVHLARPCGCASVYRSGAEYPRYMPGSDACAPADLGYFDGSQPNDGGYGNGSHAPYQDVPPSGGGFPPPAGSEPPPLERLPAE